MSPLCAVATRSAVRMERHGADPARAVAEADLGIGCRGRPELDRAVHAARGGLAPSGLKATQWTNPVWPWNVASERPLATSQSRRLRSSLHETSCLLSGRNDEPADEAPVAEQGALQLARCSGPRGGSPRSQPPEAIHRPSGLKVRLQTSCRWGVSAFTNVSSSR